MCLLQILKSQQTALSSFETLIIQKVCRKGRRTRNSFRNLIQCILESWKWPLRKLQYCTVWIDLSSLTWMLDKSTQHRNSTWPTVFGPNQVSWYNYDVFHWLIYQQLFITTGCTIFVAKNLCLISWVECWCGDPVVTIYRNSRESLWWFRHGLHIIND